MILESYEKGKKIVQTNGKTQNQDGSFNMQIRVSIDGLIHQIESAKRLSEIRHTKFPMREFVKNYDLAKQAFLDGDLETVGQFFMLYVGEK